MRFLEFFVWAHIQDECFGIIWACSKQPEKPIGCGSLDLHEKMEGQTNVQCRYSFTAASLFQFVAFSFHEGCTDLCDGSLRHILLAQRLRRHILPSFMVLLAQV